MTLKYRIKQYLDAIYMNSSLAPSLLEQENELLDLIDEINLMFGGDFDKYLIHQNEIKKFEK